MSSSDLTFSKTLLCCSVPALKKKLLFCKSEFGDYLFAQLPELSDVISTSIAVSLFEEVVPSLDQLYDFLG